MIRNLKALGLALVAVFALSAVAATAASAQGKLTSDGPVTLKGGEIVSGNDILKALGIEVKCPGSTVTAHAYNTTPHGLISSGATTLTVTPLYKQTDALGKINCKAAGLPTTVDMNGCDYVVHIGATTGVADTYSGTIDIVCPVGSEITLTVFTTEADDPSKPFCILHIKAQTGLTGATAVDTTKGSIELKGTVTGIHVTRTNVSKTTHLVLCPDGTTTATGSFIVQDLITGVNSLGNATTIGLTHP